MAKSTTKRFTCPGCGKRHRTHRKTRVYWIGGECGVPCHPCKLKEWERQGKQSIGGYFHVDNNIYQPRRQHPAIFGGPSREKALRSHYERVMGIEEACPDQEVSLRSV